MRIVLPLIVVLISSCARKLNDNKLDLLRLDTIASVEHAVNVEPTFDVVRIDESRVLRINCSLDEIEDILGRKSSFVDMKLTLIEAHSSLLFEDISGVLSKLVQGRKANIGFVVWQGIEKKMITIPVGLAMGIGLHFYDGRKCFYGGETRRAWIEGEISSCNTCKVDFVTYDEIMPICLSMVECEPSEREDSENIPPIKGKAINEEMSIQDIASLAASLKLESKDYMIVMKIPQSIAIGEMLLCISKLKHLFAKRLFIFWCP
jgi:hypothetical protein